MDPLIVTGFLPSILRFLEEEDSVPYSRDFKKKPIFVNGDDEEWKTCAAVLWDVSLDLILLYYAGIWKWMTWNIRQEELLSSQCTSDDVEVNFQEMVDKLQQRMRLNRRTGSGEGTEKKSCKDNKSYIRSA
ncbi:unnamed protein product [Fraxinus pennsylvanica]|uniref:Uncharacterized protein n=1 Tax=Fraxinus pennsylvanica TaxID=56036 RepID=A0AAD1ZVI6_9LAMI|nr:unnamed protein product [Fraxinus pennsylvanica]